ncbi:peptidase inhibitor family I36 protein [Kitasatospora sp. NPDC004289]
MNRFKKLGLAAAATAGLALALATPASADAGRVVNDYCHTGDFCAFYLPNYQYTSGNQAIAWAGDNWDWAGSTQGKWGSINNNSESWYNAGAPDTYDKVKVYNYAGGSGLLFCLPRNSGIASNSGVANIASAHVWVSSC